MDVKFNLYPEGKKKAFTLSYDDGRAADYKLVEIMDKYKVKGTFHLNSGKFDLSDYVASKDVRELYKNHEISAHTVNHPDLKMVSDLDVITQITEDRKALEEICGYPVRGMSYPFGRYNDNVLNILPFVGIEYSRTTIATNGFSIPDSFLTWHPTCHHKHDIMSKLEAFDNTKPWTCMPLFYVWGHSYEFNNDNNWNVIDEFLDKISGRDELWYATNIEIVDYITAVKSLKFSVDKKIVFNTSYIPVWISVDGAAVKINPGLNNL